MRLEAIEVIISYREEDLFVDYKETFDASDEKQWNGITTDVMAFSNTMGGYIVFGIKDIDFDVVGLPDEVINILSDTNLVMQKINRHVLPPFTAIRTKTYKLLSGQNIVVMYVPESKGRTHIFVKDVSYKYKSGTSKLIAYAGMIYIRRSATNHIVDPEDLEFIINRRINYFKESILSKISKVVEAPTEHELLMFDPHSKIVDDKTYLISNSPDAIPVKGMSFTIVPKTDVEEICGWISLSKKDPSFRPSEARLWYMYSERKNLTLNLEQVIEMVKFSFLGEIPVFYWLSFMIADEIKPLLFQIYNRTNNKRAKEHLSNVAAFLGNKFRNKVIKKYHDDSDRFYPIYHKFPSDPYEPFCKDIINYVNKETDEIKLTKLSNDISKGNGGVIEKWKARALDCKLYARTDKYEKRIDNYIMDIEDDRK